MTLTGGASAPMALPRGLWPPAVLPASLLTAPATGSLRQSSPCNDASQAILRGHSALGAQPQPPLAPQHPWLRAKLPHVRGVPPARAALSRQPPLVPLWAGPGLPSCSAICDAWYPLPDAAPKHHLSPPPSHLEPSSLQPQGQWLTLKPGCHALADWKVSWLAYCMELGIQSLRL